MKKIVFAFAFILAVIAWIIVPNIYSRQPIEFNRDCVSYNIGDDSYDLVNVQLKGEIRKKLFEDRGEVDLELQVGSTKYPINTEKMKAIENRKPVTFDPYDIDSVPAINYIQTYCLYYEDYILIPVQYFYWNDRYKEIYQKDHGTLYISTKTNDIVFAPLIDTGSDWSWSFDEGYPVIVSGEDVLDSLENIQTNFGWKVQSWIDYYKQYDRN